MREKGQLEGMDIVFSVLAFLLLFAFASILWADIFTNAAKGRQLERLKIKATEIADQVVLSPGSPGNWHNAAGYNKLGLAVKPRVISNGRLDALKNADYNSLKAKMNIEGNDYLVELRKDSNTFFSKGIVPANPDFGVKVERIVVYNNDTALLSVILYG